MHWCLNYKCTQCQVVNPVMLVQSQSNSVDVIGGVTLALHYRDTDQTLAHKWLHTALKFLWILFYLACSLCIMFVWFGLS